jgi:hypothetical protein
VSSAIAETPPVARRASARGLIVWSVVCFVLYTLFTTASRSRCFGYTGADGTVARSDSTDGLTPMCVSQQLGPSGIVQAAVIAIVVVAIARSRRRPDEAASRRTLQRAALAVVVLCLGSMALAQTWFFVALPLEPTSVNYSRPLPIPVGWVEQSVRVG